MSDAEPAVTRSDSEVARYTRQLSPQLRLHDQVRWAAIMHDLASAYIASPQGDSVANIGRAIDVLHAAIDAVPVDADVWPLYMLDLSAVLETYYDRTGELSALDQAVGLVRRVIVQRQPHTPPKRPWADRLTQLLHRRYKRTADPGDEQLAARLAGVHVAGRQAVVRDPLEWQALQAKAEQGDPDAIDQAIRGTEGLLAIRTLEDDADPDGRMILLDGLAGLLAERFQVRGDVLALERSLQLMDGVIARTSRTSSELPGRLSRWAIKLKERYALTSEPADLERAVAACEQAIAALNHAEGPVEGRESVLQNTGGVFRTYFERTHERDFLDRAIATWEAAVLESNGQPSTPDLSNLANALADRSKLAREALDTLADVFRQPGLSVAELITLADTLVQGGVLPPQEARSFADGLASPVQAVSAVATTFAEQSVLSAGRDDLNRAIDLYRQALTVEIDPPGSPGWIFTHGSYAQALVERSGTAAAAATDLDDGIGILDDVLGHCPPGSPYNLGVSLNLAGALRRRQVRGEEPADLARGVELYRQTTERALEAASAIALMSSRSWGEWALTRGAWEEAAEAFGKTADARERLLRVQTSDEWQQAWLREAQAAASGAAYSLARAGRLEEATVALEHAHARTVSEVLDRDRANLEDLKPAGHADLYERYTAAAGAWRALQRAHQVIGPRWSGVDRSEKLRRARAELDSATHAIQQLPGFEGFLSLPGYAEIQAAARQGALVYVCSTSAGGVALIVRTGQPVTYTWLPELTTNQVSTRAFRYVASSAWWRLRHDLESDVERQQWLATLDDTTQWSWEAGIGTLLDDLHTGEAAALVTTGYLSLLPLHAAWTADSRQPTGRRYACDSHLLTYVANARALLTSQELTARSGPDAILAVDQPLPVSGPPLPNAAVEVAAAVSTFARNCVLQHEAATLAAVREHLAASYPVLHFACHAAVNQLEPLASGVVLANDRVLRLAELLELRLSGARLAVLSACETAAAGLKNPDEVISLPSALLEAGVAGTVASLWAVRDESTTMLMLRFYALWRPGGQPALSPAEALRLAQVWVRDTTNDQKANYFQSLVSDSATAPGVAAAARVLFRSVALLEPSEQTFQHPFHWAAFTFTGT